MSPEGERAGALPCPFCGGVAIEVHSKINNLWTARCDNGRCLAEGPWRMDKGAALAGWNYRRTPDPATVRVLEAAKAWHRKRNARFGPYLAECEKLSKAVEALAGRWK